MRAVRLLVLALSLAALPVSGAAAQAPAAPPTASADTGVITVGPPVEAASPAPAGAAFQGPPRTLRGYWHLFVAFAIAWLLLFGYTVSLVRRFARVERELAARG